MKFEEGGSGGSGGSIGIKSNFIFGKGDLSAVGGDSDRTGCVFVFIFIIFFYFFF